MYCIHTFPHCCCCHFVSGLELYFLASAASAFSTVIHISGFGVVRWCLTLSFTSGHGIIRLEVQCTAAREMSSVAVASGSRQEREAVCRVRHNFPITCNMERKQKDDFAPIRTRESPAASNTHLHQKALCYVWKLPIWTCELDPHEKLYVGNRDCATRRTPTHLPAGIEGIRTHASTSLLRTSAAVFWLASVGE